MFYRNIPHPWKPGYVIPDYVLAEPPGRGVFRTKYLPRKTIQTLIPQYLSGDEMPVVPGSDEDPIAQFGRDVASYISNTLYDLQPDMRKPALRALFNALEPGLYERVARKASMLAKERDMGPKEALERAIAASVSTGLLKELVSIGKRGAIDPKSMAGLGAYGEPSEQIVLSDFAEHMDVELQALGFCGPICAAKKVGGGIKKGVRGIGRGVKSGVRGIGRGLGAAGRWAGDAVKKIGGAACTVLQSPVGQSAAAAGGAAYGGPAGAQAGAMGAQIAAQACGPGQQPALPPAPPPPPPLPIVPIALGGAALIGVLLLTRK